ncbi:Uncharacterized conserved protein, DUF1800 family [Dyella jiangningensis]|uniref:DUF1800 domain-containing protein n=1 Tax=Dyella sp. AtDHG13 TaxID=1938897 RepID=UPI00087EC013|nr:DUF1800 domain-containing protein [Dyella sp. AtDHG13]PXV61736.1 uncharacterized protein (DUF1800 family) [Dyella sp. AtDHG13]SDJ65623.1 Uncharacterized conserved protein, DUF1800 family [Dyella jiangningensis]
MQDTPNRPSLGRRSWLAAISVLLVLGTSAAAARSGSALSQDDVDWLRRDSFELDTATVAMYRDLGRSRLLDRQLDGRISDDLPAPITALINSYEAANTPTEQVLAGLRDEQEKIKAMPDGDEKTAAKKAQQQHANDLLQQAQEIEMLHAVYGPNQLKEQMVWFWLNHFSVYGAKGRVRWVAADYVQNTIRPHALGKFRDLVMATLESPAMMEFLDNAQNAKGHVNENYARELMELHTLGVGSGYTQQDVQQLALILTGAGVAPLRDPDAMRPRVAEMVVRNGMFEFNPKRHDFSDKVLLGHKIKGSGFDEISEAVDIITKQPACAQFVSKKLAEYFVADQPPPELVAKMARTFQRTDGDIAEVLRTMFESRELAATYGKKFKDPMQFVVSSVRMAYDGKPIANAKPLLNWLNQLGEPVFGRLTPDGWPLDSTGWSSSGQMAKRFEIAGAIGTGNNRLLTPEGQPKSGGDFPMLTTRLYYDTFDTKLSAPTREALAKATTQQEWNTFLLSSPDFNYR